jgi:MarR family transcriptional regulator, 2-MHQ and catechol-resistance regulon repressor
MNQDPATRRALKLWVVLSRAQAAIAGLAARDVSRHDLSLVEFGALEALYHKGPMLVGELQRRILISSGGITFLVDRLARRGLVERREYSDDRRARLIALTAAGERLIADIFPAHAAAIRRAVAGVSPAVQRELIDGLRALGVAAEHLGQREPSAPAENLS